MDSRLVNRPDLGAAPDHDWVIVDTDGAMKGSDPTGPPPCDNHNLPPTLLVDADAAIDDRGLAAQFEAYMTLDAGYDPATKTAPTVETMGSDDTLNDGARIYVAGIALPGPHPASARGSAWPDSRLTENTLERYQQQLAELSPGDLRQWLDAAAPGFTRHNVVTRDAPSSYLAVRSFKESRGATDASFEMVARPDAVGFAADDIRAAGTMFDGDIIGSFVYDTPYLTLD